MKYILYCAQEANFQTRSMLIPYDLFIECPQRAQDLQILRENALCNVPIKNHVVDQLLIQNITWSGNMGTPDDSPFRRIVSELTSYANGMDKDCYCKLYDKPWADHIICNVASKGFNNVSNYCNYRNRPEIVEGFLVLESDDGKLNMPSVDTVEEMFAKYYDI